MPTRLFPSVSALCPPLLCRLSLKVELNTIASSFGCMSALTARMHRHILGRFAREASNAGKAVRDHATSVGVDVQQLNGDLGKLIPENPTLTALPGALAAAHKCYGKQDAVVLFVVQPGETNAVDQRLLEMKLWDDHAVRVVRKSLAEVSAPLLYEYYACVTWRGAFNAFGHGDALFTRVMLRLFGNFPES